MVCKVLMLASLLVQLATSIPTDYIAPRDATVSGSGILLCNEGTLNTEYCFYNNVWNGDGTAGANFDNPSTCLSVASGAATFVPLPASFKGRVQRGQEYPNTWVEFQLRASNDGFAHGDVSVEQGNDGPATIESTDGSGARAGFEKDIVAAAPESAKRVRTDGLTVLDTTMGNWNRSGNLAAIAYEARVLPTNLVYVSGSTGVDDTCSHNNAMKVTFY